jgi:uncharacterized protein (TIGR03086 family)
MDHVVRLMKPQQWMNATPCENWSAKHVIGHVIAIQKRNRGLITDNPVDLNPFENPDQYAGDDPHATWTEILDSVLEALDHPGLLDKVVNGYAGPTTVDNMIGFNIGDTTVHAWDLARSAGVDDHLDPVLVARVLANIEPRIDMMRGAGFFGPAGDAGGKTDAQSRLLAMVGRNP